MTGLRARPYRIEEYTRTVCPLCPPRPDAFVDGMLVSHDGAVWMRRLCPVHGQTESLYEEDLEIWLARFGWGTPTLEMTPDRPENVRGFPDGYQDGLPVSHGQHSCILLLNVTRHCNLSCPTCYASALDPGTAVQTPDRPSMREMLHTVDTVIRREKGKLSVVMLSGGEPTVRKDIEELILHLADRSITRIMLNTNGRRIARDDRFVKFLADHRDRIEVYLQFDGLRPSTHTALRGEDLGHEKRTALLRLNEVGVFTTLVTTVKRGVNEDEIGDLLSLGLDTPRCAGMAIQPVFGSGRGEGIDPKSRATPTGVLRRLSEQTGGQVDWQDFIPLPCSHKDCCDIAYLLHTQDGWKSLAKLVGRDELKRWLHLVSNTISFENASDAVKSLLRGGILQRVFSEQQPASAVQMAADIARICDCVPGLGEMLRPFGRQAAMERLAERTFRITVKMFMDSHTFHEHRIRQCCVHVGSYEEDPRRYSFCWRWMFEEASDLPKLRVIQP